MAMRINAHGLTIIKRANLVNRNNKMSLIFRLQLVALFAAVLITFSLAIILQQATIAQAQTIAAQYKPQLVTTNNPIDKVTFFANNIVPTVTVTLNGEDGRLSNKQDNFFMVDDQRNEFPSAIAYNTKSQTYYIAIATSAGQNIGAGKIRIGKNRGDNYLFESKQDLNAKDLAFGTPIALAVINDINGTPKGLAVLSVFFDIDPLVSSKSDTISLVIYKLNSDGMVMLNNENKPVKTILFSTKSNKDNPLPTPPLINNGRIADFSFGGMAVDNNGNLYVSLSSKADSKQNDNKVIGNIFVYKVKDSDGLPVINVPPDKFLASDDISGASSIIALNNNRMAAFVFVIANGNVSTSQILIYRDIDNNLMADGTPDIFYTEKDDNSTEKSFSASIKKIGAAYATTKMNFITDAHGNNNRALFSFFNKQISGLAVVNGAGTDAIKAVDAPSVAGIAGFITCVGFSVESSAMQSGDTQLPQVSAVQITDANGAEQDQFMLGQNVSIRIQASDNISVKSFSIALIDKKKNKIVFNGNQFNVEPPMANVDTIFTVTLPDIKNLKKKPKTYFLMVKAQDQANNQSESFTSRDFIISR